MRNLDLDDNRKLPEWFSADMRQVARFIPGMSETTIDFLKKTFSKSRQVPGNSFEDFQRIVRSILNPCFTTQKPFDLLQVRKLCTGAAFLLMGFSGIFEKGENNEKSYEEKWSSFYEQAGLLTEHVYKQTTRLPQERQQKLLGELTRALYGVAMPLAYLQEKYEKGGLGVTCIRTRLFVNQAAVEGDSIVFSPCKVSSKFLAYEFAYSPFAFQREVSVDSIPVNKLDLRRLAYLIKSEKNASAELKEIASQLCGDRFTDDHLDPTPFLPSGILNPLLRQFAEKIDFRKTANNVTGYINEVLQAVNAFNTAASVDVAEVVIYRRGLRLSCANDHIKREKLSIAIAKRWIPELTEAEIDKAKEEILPNIFYKDLTKTPIDQHLLKITERVKKAFQNNSNDINAWASEIRQIAYSIIEFLGLNNPEIEAREKQARIEDFYFMAGDLIIQIWQWRKQENCNMSLEYLSQLTKVFFGMPFPERYLNHKFRFISPEKPRMVLGVFINTGQFALTYNNSTYNNSDKEIVFQPAWALVWPNFEHLLPYEILFHPLNFAETIKHSPDVVFPFKALVKRELEIDLAVAEACSLQQAEEAANRLVETERLKVIGLLKKVNPQKSIQEINKFIRAIIQQAETAKIRQALVEVLVRRGLFVGNLCSLEIRSKRNPTGTKFEASSNVFVDSEPYSFVVKRREESEQEQAQARRIYYLLQVLFSESEKKSQVEISIEELRTMISDLDIQKDNSWKLIVNVSGEIFLRQSDETKGEVREEINDLFKDKLEKALRKKAKEQSDTMILEALEACREVGDCRVKEISSHLLSEWGISKVVYRYDKNNHTIHINIRKSNKKGCFSGERNFPLNFCADSKNFATKFEQISSFPGEALSLAILRLINEKAQDERKKNREEKLRDKVKILLQTIPGGNYSVKLRNGDETIVSINSEGVSFGNRLSFNLEEQAEILGDLARDLETPVGEFNTSLILLCVMRLENFVDSLRSCIKERTLDGKKREKLTINQILFGENSVEVDVNYGFVDCETNTNIDISIKLKFSSEKLLSFESQYPMTPELLKRVSEFLLQVINNHENDQNKAQRAQWDLLRGPLVWEEMQGVQYNFAAQTRLQFFPWDFNGKKYIIIFIFDIKNRKLLELWKVREEDGLIETLTSAEIEQLRSEGKIIENFSEGLLNLSQKKKTEILQAICELSSEEEKQIERWRGNGGENTPLRSVRVSGQRVRAIGKVAIDKSKNPYNGFIVAEEYLNPNTNWRVVLIRENTEQSRQYDVIEAVMTAEGKFLISKGSLDNYRKAHFAVLGAINNYLEHKLLEDPQPVRGNGIVRVKASSAARDLELYFLVYSSSDDAQISVSLVEAFPLLASGVNLMQELLAAAVLVVKLPIDSHPTLRALELDQYLRTNLICPSDTDFSNRSLFCTTIASPSQEILAAAASLFFPEDSMEELFEWFKESCLTRVDEKAFKKIVIIASTFLTQHETELKEKLDLELFQKFKQKETLNLTEIRQILQVLFSQENQVASFRGYVMKMLRT